MPPASIESLFAGAGAEGWLHVRDIASGRAIGHRESELVVMASTFKIVVLLELVAQADAGRLGLDARVRVPASNRCIGPTGLSAMSDDVELSVRDLALLMMSVSDNAATDVLMRVLGHDAVLDRPRRCGMAQTVLVGDCASLLESFHADAGVDVEEGLTSPTDVTEEHLRRWRSIDPERTTRTTPEELTDLLARIWRDEASSPAACAEARRLMSMQVWPHRLVSAFPDGVTVSSKTGTLPSWRNEAGVIEYPDGARYAVAIFTRTPTFEWRNPAVDAVIGSTARHAIDQLRSTG